MKRPILSVLLRLNPFLSAKNIHVIYCPGGTRVSSCNAIQSTPRCSSGCQYAILIFGRCLYHICLIQDDCLPHTVSIDRRHPSISFYAAGIIPQSFHIPFSGRYDSMGSVSGCTHCDSFIHNLFRTGCCGDIPDAPALPDKIGQLIRHIFL